MPDLETIVEKLDLLIERTGLEAGSEQRYLGVTGAARYSGLSEESIRRLLATRKLTGYRPIAGRVLIDRRELDALIRAADGRPRAGRGIRRVQA